MILDGENCILGRLAAVVAKKALKGEKIEIYNAEKILITGNPESIVKSYAEKMQIKDRAKPIKSPKFSRRPDLFVKKTIRGMLPIKKRRGVEAFKNIKVYMGPGKKGEKIAEAGELKAKKITVLDLCKRLG